jgi:hypothetical protein
MPPSRAQVLGHEGFGRREDALHARRSGQICDLAGRTAGDLPRCECESQATTRLRKYERTMWRL